MPGTNHGGSGHYFLDMSSAERHLQALAPEGIAISIAMRHDHA